MHPPRRNECTTAVVQTIDQASIIMQMEGNLQSCHEFQRTIKKICLLVAISGYQQL